jgi:hypothetical protein
MIEQLAQQRAVQLRWRAATQIHRLNHLTSFIIYLASILHLPAHSIHISLTQYQRRGGIEVAIHTATLTKRDMDIDACHFLGTNVQKKSLLSRNLRKICIFVRIFQT